MMIENKIAMMKKRDIEQGFIIRFMGMVAFLVLLVPSLAFAMPNKANWAMIDEGDSYTKYFAPASVKILKSVSTERGRIATEIKADIRIDFSLSGAKSTIDFYNISGSVKASELAYSLATVTINPQNRTLMYNSEILYDKNDKVLWSTGASKEKEMNSLAFDEPFYHAIVDNVFRIGETKRANAKDRWINLWSNESAEGTTTTVTADTTTMRLRGDNLILWTWTEMRDKDSNMLEVRFEKKAVNIVQGTERIIRGEVWTAKDGWQDLDDELDGAYRMIDRKHPEYRGYTRLRAFSKGYSMWVNRYRIK